MTNLYNYIFSNSETHTMTPLEAHKYAHRKNLRVVGGPGYKEGKKERSFAGWGWHDTLKMSFRGPNHYREYLKEHNMVEWGSSDCPQYKEVTPPVWNDETLRMAAQQGIEIGSVLADALKSGAIQWPDQA
jgi:hypothetical protein